MVASLTYSSPVSRPDVTEQAERAPARRRALATLTNWLRFRNTVTSCIKSESSSGTGGKTLRKCQSSDDQPPGRQGNPYSPLGIDAARPDLARCLFLPG